MCGCSSNFDGVNDIEDVKSTVFLDFDGEFDDNDDDDFDDFFRSKTKKDCISRMKSAGKSNKDARKLCRLEKRGDDVATDPNAPKDKKGCMTFYKDKGMSRKSARNKCKVSNSDPVYGESKDAEEEVDETVTADEKGNPKSVAPANELSTGLSRNAKIGLAVGGVLLLGIGGFFIYRKMRK